MRSPAATYAGRVAAPVEHSDSFSTALESLRAVTFRAEFDVHETPAPQRLAPFAVAITADVVVDDEELASGRLVLLHDPDGVEEWQGRFRIVAYVRAELDPEAAVDPLVQDVAWSWLTEALDGVEVVALGGTVTKNSSQSFGTMADRPVDGNIELRVSWTPTTDVVTDHVTAWARLLETAAGLEPVPEGVSVLGQRRSKS